MLGDHRTGEPRQRANVPANTPAPAVVANADKFGFGENWRSFLDELDDARIAEAEKALQWMLSGVRIDGSRFLDIGSGSGLSSLAARRLGAVVHSFDYDRQSVECTKTLRDRFFPGDAAWVVESGSILDGDYLAKLGQFDVVYSWGVLHHTGAMYKSLKNAAGLVSPGGLFAFALYRKTRLCWFWTLEKRWYCRASAQAQSACRRVYVALMRLAFAATGRNFNAYVGAYRGNRGMSYVHDVHDWLGGYPYESIRPAEVEHEMARIGFTRIRSKVQGYSWGLFGSGCDEYVFRNSGSPT